MTIRHELSKLRRQISLCGNEVYYPAVWRFGEGVGDASTSQPVALWGSYNIAIAQLITEEFCRQHDLPEPGELECGGLRGAAQAVADIIRRQRARDADTAAVVDAA